MQPPAVPDGLSKETQRVISVINSVSSSLQSGSQDFNSSKIDWDSTEWRLQKARIEQEMHDMSHCRDIDSCASLEEYKPDLCPLSSSCAPVASSTSARSGSVTAFECRCPNGFWFKEKPDSLTSDTTVPVASSGGGERRSSGGLIGGGLLNPFNWLPGRRLLMMGADDVGEGEAGQLLRWSVCGSLVVQLMSP